MIFIILTIFIEHYSTVLIIIFYINGWAVIDLGDNNSITLHGVPKEKLLARNFNITGVPESNSPVISNITWSSQEVDVTSGPVDITLTLTITDESGIQDFTTYPVATPPPDSDYRAYGTLWELVSGDNKNGTYQTTFTVDSNAKPGDYSVYGGGPKDIYENFTLINIARGDAFTVINDNFN